MNPTPTSFSSLPPELVSQICTHLSLRKNDLISLRLTGKGQGIHASATRAFGKRCFTTVPLLYTKYSLETFVKICQHPVFGPCIRRIRLSCLRFDPDDFMPLASSMTTWDLDRDEFVQHVQLLSARCDAQESLELWDAKVLLERAFSQLAKSDQSLTFAVSMADHDALGASRVFEPEGDTDYVHADIPFALRLLFASAKRAGCRVAKLDIAVAARAFSSQDYDCDLSDLVRSITELSLEFCFINDFGEDEPTEMIPWVGDLLSWVSNVKVLHICPMIFDDHNGDQFAIFSQAISHLPLEKLSLQDVFIRHETMVSLLEKLGPTLRRLTLLCEIIGSWKEVLVSIQQNANQLDRLRIYASFDVPSWLKGLKTFNSMTAVRSGLENLLEAELHANKALEDTRDDE